MRVIVFAMLFTALVFLATAGGIWLDNAKISNPFYRAVQAAPTPISDNCAEVATVGLLEVYLCQTPYGDLFVNSFGFMTPVD